MTAFADKLKSAGADTIGAQLTTACASAARLHPNDIESAWRAVGDSFGYDFLHGIMADMRMGVLTKVPKRIPFPIIPTVGPILPKAGGVPSYKPQVIPQERLVKRRELEKKREELRAVFRSKFRTRDGRLWSEVGWHELPSMVRDGAEAKALLSSGPANVPNDGRNVGEVMGKRTDEILSKIRG